jgi:hypothetical protein
MLFYGHKHQFIERLFGGDSLESFPVVATYYYQPHPGKWKTEILNHIHQSGSCQRPSVSTYTAIYESEDHTKYATHEIVIGSSYDGRQRYRG